MKFKMCLPAQGALQLIIAIMMLPVSCSFVTGAEKNMSGFERYNVIFEHNIYLKDRKEKPAPVLDNVRPPATEAPVQIFVESNVLKGIARHGGEYAAFFENPSTGETARVRGGEKFMGGIIEDITIDYVGYDVQGAVSRIKIGEKIEQVHTGTYRTIIRGGTGSTRVPATSTEDRDSALLEQLRLRRLREVE